jgi:hypothetical protein
MSISDYPSFPIASNLNGFINQMANFNAPFRALHITFMRQFASRMYMTLASD